MSASARYIPTLLVVGGGRIGTALVEASAAVVAGGQLESVGLVTRTSGDAWLAGPRPGHDEACPLGTPVCLCVRNEDLEAVLARVPPARWNDLVVLQNGMVRPWLAAHGLQGVTRGLLFFAVAARGDRPSRGAVSPFCGPHAARIVAWLTSLGLPAAEAGAAEFAAVELEKLMWNSVFGLLCQVHGCDVGTVCRAHAADVQALVAELLAVAGDGHPWTAPHLAARLIDYSLAIASYRGAVKDWPWRNGWFVQRARVLGLATPLHDQLLRVAGITAT